MRMGWDDDARAALWRWKRDDALALGQGMAAAQAPQGLLMAGMRTHASRSDRTAWHVLTVRYILQPAEQK